MYTAKLHQQRHVHQLNKRARKYQEKCFGKVAAVSGRHTFKFMSLCQGVSVSNIGRSKNSIERRNKHILLSIILEIPL